MATIPITPRSPLDRHALDILVADGKAEPTAMRTLHCRTVAQGRLRQLNYIRDLPPQPVMEDEPEGDSIPSIAAPSRLEIRSANEPNVRLHSSVLAPVLTGARAFIL